MLETVLDVLGPRPILLERDDGFAGRAALEAELDALMNVVSIGGRRGPRAEDESRPRPVVDADRPDETSRDALVDRQATLVSAVLGDGPEPDGFDASTLSRLRQKLVAKAAWVAARRGVGRVEATGQVRARQVLSKLVSLWTKRPRQP
jgi:hypothetical protein